MRLGNLHLRLQHEPFEIRKLFVLDGQRGGHDAVKFSQRHLVHAHRAENLALMQADFRHAGIVIPALLVLGKDGLRARQVIFRLHSLAHFKQRRFLEVIRRILGKHQQEIFFRLFVIACAGGKPRSGQGEFDLIQPFHRRLVGFLRGNFRQQRRAIHFLRHGVFGGQHQQQHSRQNYVSAEAGPLLLPSGHLTMYSA